VPALERGQLFAACGQPRRVDVGGGHPI
jgi:hypothetical protein